jgi:hypothetical protein
MLVGQAECSSGASVNKSSNFNSAFRRLLS